MFVSSIENLSYVTDEYTRLYYGNEFCQERIPTPDEMRYVYDFARSRGLQLTWVTPYVTERGLEALRPLAAFVASAAKDSEFVVNDWGAWRVLHDEYGCTNFVLGRLLAQQKRDPQISRMRKETSGAAFEDFQQAVADASIMAPFLRERKIARIEIDNLLQGIKRPKASLPASLYLPYVFVSTTKFCPLACAWPSARVARNQGACSRQCNERGFTLRHRVMPVPLYLYGNAYFFKHERLPARVREYNINRMVWQPEIPF